MKKKKTNHNQKELESIAIKDSFVLDMASSIIDTTSDGVIVSNLKGDITHWNNGAAKMYKYSKDEVLGKNVTLLYKPENLISTKERIERVLLGETFQNDEVQVLDKEGNTLTVLMSLNGIKDGQGKISHIVGITKDITEIKDTEAKLKQTETLFSSAISAIGEGFVVQDLSDKILSANQAAADILGLTMNQLLGKDSFDPRWKALHEDGSPFNPQDYPSVITGRTGKPVHDVLMNVHAGKNTRKWILINSRPVFDNNKVQTSSVTTFLDITEQKLAQKTLEDSEHRFAQAFDNSPIPISILNLKKAQRIAVNNAFCNNFGYSKRELLNQGDLCKQNIAVDQKEFQKIVKSVINKGTVVDYPFSMYTKSGEIREVLVNATRVYPDSKDVYITSYLDVTESNKAKRDLVESEKILKAIFDHHFQLTGLLDSKGKILAVNKTALKFVNKKEEDVIGKYFWDTPWWDSSQESIVKSAIQNARNGKFVRFETTNNNKLGEKSYVDFSLNPVFDDSGKVIYLVPEGRDITDRKIAEERIKESEENINAILNSLKESVCVINDQGQILKVNDSWIDFGEANQNNVVPIPHTDYNYFDVCRADLQDKDAKNVLEGLLGLLQGKTEEFSYEYPCHSPEIKRWFLLRADLMKTKEKQIVISHMDITDRKLSEENIKETLMQLNLAVDTAKLGIWVLIMETEELEWNDKLLDIYGLTRDEFNNNLDGWRNQVHPDDKDYADGRLQEVFKNKPVFNVNFRIFKPDGEMRYIDASAAPVFDSEENLIKIIGINRDVTEDKKAEKKIEQANAELKEAVSSLNELKKQLEDQNIYLKKELDLVFNFQEMVYGSALFSEVLSDLERVAPTDASVLILGESGTGKELLARALHNLSLRKEQPFIKVNCSAIPSELIESELFGHKKGSFTGAVSDKIGKFELADGGTLFLDEIGDLPLGMQPKLLRFLQEGEMEVVGGTTTKSLDVRVVAATNKNLKEEVNKEQFREDLFFRLNVFPITVPALRERKEDIPLLVEHFCDKFGKKYRKQIKYISDAAMQNMTAYNWPGNIRELENLVERSVILSDSETLNLQGFDSDNGKKSRPISNTELTLNEVQRNHILSVLNRTNWKIDGKNGAAKILDLKPSTFRDKMKKLDIKRPK